MEKQRVKNVIGTAVIQMDQWNEFRAKERKKREAKEKCWPAAKWQDYFYDNQDLCKYAEVGYYNCNCLNHTPSDELAGGSFRNRIICRIVTSISGDFFCTQYLKI